MNTEEIIRINLSYLTDHITNLLKVLLYLRENDIVSTNEAEQIEVQKTTAEKNYKLLNILQRKKLACQTFLEILRSTGNEHCADKIEGTSSQQNRSLKHPMLLRNLWWPTEKDLIKSLYQRKIGSKLLVEELQEKLSNHDSQTVVICEFADVSKLTGLGGVGKTLTAKWYAHCHGKEYNHVIWIDCGEDSLKPSFQKLARDLEVRHLDKLLDLEDFSIKSYEELKDLKCLWIFDNAESSLGPKGIQKILPKKYKNFYCVITSRSREWGNAHGLGELPKLELKVFEDWESVDFLKETLVPNVKWTEEQLKELCVLLGNLPLALQLAVSALNRGKMTLRKYIERKQLRGIIDTPFDDYEKTINENINIANELIANEKYGDTANEILLIFGYIRPDGISSLFFQDVLLLKSDELEEGVELLLKYSLISQDVKYLHDDEAETSFTIHRLMQQVIRHNDKKNEKEILRKILGCEGHLDYKIYPFLNFADEDLKNEFPKLKVELLDQEQLLKLRYEENSFESTKLAAFIAEKVTTVTAKFNHAVCLEQHGQLEEAKGILEELSMNNTLKENDSKSAVQMGILNLDAKLTKDLIGGHLLVINWRMENIKAVVGILDKRKSFRINPTKESLKACMEILNSHLINSNYSLTCYGSFINLHLDVASENYIGISNRLVDLSDLPIKIHTLSLKKSDVCKTVEIKLTKLELLTLTGMSTSWLSHFRSVQLNELRVEDSSVDVSDLPTCVQILSLTNTKIEGEGLELIELHYLRLLNTSSDWLSNLHSPPLDEIKIENSSVDISNLPGSLRKLGLYNTEVVISGQIDFPNLSFLALRGRSAISLSHWSSPQLTEMEISNSSVDISNLPQTIQNLILRQTEVVLTGKFGLANLKFLQIEGNSFCWSHFRSLPSVTHIVYRGIEEKAGKSLFALPEIKFSESYKKVEKREASIDISVLPPTIQNLTLSETEVVASGGIDLPNLKYLELCQMSSSCLSLFKSLQLTQICFIDIEGHVNLDLVPENVNSIRIDGFISIVGEKREINRLILLRSLENHLFVVSRLEKVLNIIKPTVLIIHQECDPNDWKNIRTTCINFNKKDLNIETLVIGPVEYTDGIAYYLFQLGKRLYSQMQGKEIDWEELREMGSLNGKPLIPFKEKFVTKSEDTPIEDEEEILDDFDYYLLGEYAHDSVVENVQKLRSINFDKNTNTTKFKLAFHLEIADEFTEAIQILEYLYQQNIKETSESNIIRKEESLNLEGELTKELVGGQLIIMHWKIGNRARVQEMLEERISFRIFRSPEFMKSTMEILSSKLIHSKYSFKYLVQDSDGMELVFNAEKNKIELSESGINPEIPLPGDLEELTLIQQSEFSRGKLDLSQWIPKSLRRLTIHGCTIRIGEGMEYEGLRLKTFKTLDEDSGWSIPAEDMAEAGFFLLEQNKIKCAFCECVFSKSEVEYKLLANHERNFPDCSSNSSTNISIGKRIVISLNAISNVQYLDLSNCLLNIDSGNKLSLKELNLDDILLERNGIELKLCDVNEFVNFQSNPMKMTLSCANLKNMSLDMSQEIALLLYLELRSSVKMKNWETAKWNVHKLLLNGISFRNPTSMKIKELEMDGVFHLNISVLPRKIEKLVLSWHFPNKKTVFASKQIILPELKYLELKNEAFLASFFEFLNKKNIMPNVMNPFRVVHISHFDFQLATNFDFDLFPESVDNVKISRTAGMVDGGLTLVGRRRRINKLVLNGFNLDEMEEVLYHLYPNLLRISNAFKPEEVFKLNQKKIIEIAVGKIDWGEESFSKSSLYLCVNKKSKYYLLKEGKGKAIEKSEFDEFPFFDKISTGYPKTRAEWLDQKEIAKLTNESRYKEAAELATLIAEDSNTVAAKFNYTFCLQNIPEKENEFLKMLEEINTFDADSFQKTTASGKNLEFIVTKKSLKSALKIMEALKVKENAGMEFNNFIFLFGSNSEMCVEFGKLFNCDISLLKDAHVLSLKEEQQNGECTLNLNQWIPRSVETITIQCPSPFKSEKKRVNSFSSAPVWPVPFIPVQDMVNAGFFFLQKQDFVQCAFCNLVIYNWLDEDKNVRKVHEFNQPECPFLLNLDAGNIPVGQEMCPTNIIVSIKTISCAEFLNISNCSLNIDNVNKLCPKELELTDISFIWNEQELKQISLHEFVNFEQINKIVLNCKQNNLLIDMSNDVVALKYLELGNNIQILDWADAKWNVDKLVLNYIPFLEKTKMKIQEMILIYSPCNLSVLPESLNLLFLYWNSDVFANGSVDLPNLKYLYLESKSTSSLLHFRSIQVTHIYLHKVEQINVDFIPQSVTNVKVLKGSKGTTFVGSLTHVDTLILEKFSLYDLHAVLKHFHPKQLVLSHSFKHNHLIEITKLQIQTIEIGKIDWDDEEIPKNSILSGIGSQSKYFLLQDGKLTPMESSAFKRLLAFR